MLNKFIGRVKPAVSKIEKINDRAYYARCYREHAVQEQWILYEAFAGRGILCSPKAIFDALKRRVEFKGYRHIWVLDSMKAHKDLIYKYKNDPSVIFVERHSKEYLKYLAEAKYLINNSTFPGYFIKREEQVYINTWHGIPLKKMGYDMPGGNFTSANTIRNFLAADFLLSANKFQSDMYWKSYKLEGLWNGKVIETGHARNDVFWSDHRESIYEHLDSLGLLGSRKKKIILYAPTWRGDDFSKPRKEADKYLHFIEEMEKKLCSDEYQILVKPHQQVYHQIEERSDIKGKFVPSSVDTNELLSVTDILVTDYSSIYFDFLATGRPVLFYIPDLEEYEDTRGFYLPLNELPGPASQSLEDVPQWIMKIEDVQREYSTLYEKNVRWVLEYDDGHVCDRIIDAVWFGKNQSVCQQRVAEKPKILLYRGGLSENGITRSFMSLLNIIDYDKYDVTIGVEYPGIIPGDMKKLLSLNKNARCIVYIPEASGSWTELVARKKILKNGVYNDEQWEKVPVEFFKWDFRRTFGDSQFDIIVEFGGYSPVSSYLLLQAGNGKKIIWQHNDLALDAKKVIHGVKPHEKNLNTIFYLYKYYDKIVSCGKYVMKQNMKSFATSGTFHKFTYARNALDIGRLENDLKQNSISGTDLYGQTREWPDEQYINFVTMGRMSTEKNQLNLLRGFARLQEQYGNVMLHILGDGPLREEMMQEINELQIRDKVVLTGQMEYPFSYMKRCQCFILPSLYEGQPLVLYEARALGLPLIISEFSSVSDSITEGGQYLIGNSEDEIYEGMEAFMKGKVPEYNFSADEYNSEVFQEFEKAVLG